jgi:hypothetical protein
MSMTLRKEVDVTAADWKGMMPGTVTRRRTCLSMHAVSEEVRTREAAKKMPARKSIECSRMISEDRSSLRWLFISRSISGVMALARIEDPAGGVS